jgi:hypothetical protein
MANTIRNAAKERYWRGVLKRAAKSDLSVRAFCRRERLAEGDFYAWRRTIAERDRELAKRPEVRQPTLSFLPLHVTDGATAVGHTSVASISIELAGGRLLRLPESISVERITELVHALEARAER